MGTGYTRQSSATIIDDAVVEAADLNAEFNLLESAFNASTGHSHDGTSGEGPKIVLTAAAGISGTLPVANGGTGATTEAAAASALGVGTEDSPQFTGIELGHATDTTLTRSAAGVLAVEGGAGGLYVASIELGALSDTTITRSSAGVIAVEGVTVPLNSITNIHTAQQIELGHASDTTITRTGAGAIAVEGVGVALNSTSLTHTASTIELGHATDTTISRVSAGLIAVEGVNVPLESRANTFTGANTFSTATHTFTTSTSLGIPLEIIGTNAANGPELSIYGNSASPAASDTIGQISFYGNDNGIAKQLYATIRTVISDTTATSEDAYLSFRTTIAGTTSERWNIGAGLYATGTSDMGGGSINAGSYFINGTSIFGTANNWTVAQQISSIELGAASDTTITRSAAGVIAVEGGVIPKENRSNTFSALQAITSSSANSTLLQVTNTADTTGSSIQFNHDATTPANGDVLGNLSWRGKDSGGAADVVAIIQVAAEDITAGSEDYILQFRTMRNGARGTKAQIGDGLYLGSATDPGSGSVNVSGGYYIAGTDIFARANTWTKEQVFNDTATSNTPLQVVSDSSGTVGPYLSFYQNSGSPAANDYPGGILFYGEDSAGGSPIYASIYTRIVDPTNLSEDGVLETWTTIAGTDALRSYVGHGLVVGAPTGGDKGAGTINAVGVYDDNTLLTCYIADVVDTTTGDEISIDAAALTAKWDAFAPDRVLPAEYSHRQKVDPVTGEFMVDERGNPIREKVEVVPERIEQRTHFGARKFFQRLGTEYDPRDIAKAMKHFKDKKHLTNMPNPETFVQGSMSAGDWIQRLVEQAELQMIWTWRERRARIQAQQQAQATITTLQNTITALEARIAALEAQP